MKHLSLLLVLCLLTSTALCLDSKQGNWLSLDVKSAPFGAYDATFIATVQQRWHDLLDNTQLSKRVGKVVINFQLTHTGQVEGMKVITNEVGEALSLLAKKAILDPAPYAPWPRAMRQTVGKQSRDLMLTFHYFQPRGKLVPELKVISPDGEAYTSYRSFVHAAYENAWQFDPKTVSEELLTQARVVISRRGGIVSAKMTKPSGNKAFDRSVERALDSITSLPPFPAGARDEERAFTFKFSLAANGVDLNETDRVLVVISTNLVAMAQQLTNAPTADRPDKFRALVKEAKREHGFRANAEVHAMLRQAYVESFPMDAKVKDTILAQKIHIGMTSEQVRAAWDLFTESITVNETVTAGGKSEQWVLSSGTYLFFDNDILTSWHSTKQK